MTLLVAGLIVFFAIHCVPMAGGTRAALIGRFGENGYKGLFSLVSAVGLGLIVYGYGDARMEGPPLLYDPPEWTRHVTMLLMVPVFILLVAAYVPGKIKKMMRHPMLVAIKLWAFAHLLANGDLASVLLFGSFLAFAVIDRISLKRRALGGEITLTDTARRNELIAILGGLLVYAVFVWAGHDWVTGVPLM